VLVVDDSAYNRRNIAGILAGSDEIEVVGKAHDGDEALRLVSALHPDAITLDLEMPRMDGFTFLRILMATQPTPVIVVSSYSAKDNVFKALDLGAIDFVAKPDWQAAPDAAVRGEILSKVLLVRSLRSFASLASSRGLAVPGAAPSQTHDRGGPPASRGAAVPRYLVGIASSTGGPSALLEIFTRLPERFPGAILIAQHMPDKFTRTFAERLDKKGALRVVEAQDGDPVRARCAYICPGKQSMEVVGASGFADLHIRVASQAAGERYCPSGDRLLRSIGQLGGSRTFGIILTGMGDDGVLGARAIRTRGGTVIAETEESAVVYGMPAAAVRAGVVSEQLSIGAIGDYLAGLT
jgi:two-component system chemotaxis response regulator CheB